MEPHDAMEDSQSQVLEEDFAYDDFEDEPMSLMDEGEEEADIDGEPMSPNDDDLTAPETQIAETQIEPDELLNISSSCGRGPFGPSGPTWAQAQMIANNEDPSKPT